MGEITKKVQERRGKVVWACDEKRGAMHRKDGDGIGSTRVEEETKA